MTVATTTAAGKSSNKGNSGRPCGCQSAECACGRLDCIEKPFFACGQLLTDQDLMALVTWAQKKIGLGRFRHGSGVVCGLDVRCDPTTEGQVIVGPGYAVSCGGDDIVVGRDTPVNLTACCPPRANPSAGKSSQPAQQSPEAESSFGGLPVTLVRTIDLYISYKEEGASPRAAFAGANCPPTSTCVYTRTRETSLIECRIGTDRDPLSAAAEKWEESYRKCGEVVRRFRETFGAETSGEQVSEWLLRWIARNPLRQFCFLPDLIGHHHEHRYERLAVEALFWLVQDCRNAFLECGCDPCQEDTGTPIARIWVRPAPMVRGNPSCRILNIDSHPPHRRLLQQECWPASPGKINAGQSIWNRPPEAAAFFAGQGMRVNAVEWQIPDSVAALEKEMDGSLQVQWDGVNKLQVFDAGSMGFRVVGITR